MMKHTSHYGCLVFAIPLTIATLYPLGFTVWTIGSQIAVHGLRMGPTGQALTMAMIVVSVAINIPTAVLWWVYFFMKRENRQLDELDEIAQESRRLHP